MPPPPSEPPGTAPSMSARWATLVGTLLAAQKGEALVRRESAEPLARAGQKGGSS
jgi:hypothetical protein